VLESPCEPISRFDGREVINLASNNYLGLADHPKLIEAQVEAAKQYGAGSGAVRTISGTMSIHMQLEERIADFKHTEACVVFQSGFAANAGTVSAILGPEDHIISDALNHASIIDGCRLSKAKIHVFRTRTRRGRRKSSLELDGVPGHKLLITDGVFSMDGDIGPLPALVEIAERHGAIMMIDDAHSSGVLGRNGRGTVDHFGLHGTGGRAGGHAVESHRRAGRICLREPRSDRVSVSSGAAVPVFDFASAGGGGGVSGGLRHSGDTSRSASRSCGRTRATSSPCSKKRRIRYRRERDPHHADHGGRSEDGACLFAALFENGLLATGIGFPTVPEGKARIRTIVTATHTREMLDRAGEILTSVAKKMGILQ
jgi:glycine C-acetyltransferase